MKYILRPRQEIAVQKVIEFINNPKKNYGVFVYPTSFGKSLVISELASKFPNKYFINVTNSKELLIQNHAKYCSYGFDASICSASLKENSVGKVTFATIGTLVKHIKFFQDKEVIILDDECQEGSATGSQLHEFTKKLKNCKLVGVTATPFRLSQGMDGSSLKMMNRDRKCFYKSIEDVVQISEVVENNYWSPLIYKVIDVDEESLKLNNSGTEYTDESIKKFKEDNSIDSKIEDEIKTLISEGRKSILVSVPFIQDAKDLEAKIEGCRAVYSGMDTKDRDTVIEGFKALKIKVVVQVKILSVGFDHPKLDAIIMAKPTNSLTFYYQYLGRGVRIHPSKKDCVVVDLSGNFNKFGRIETITIENHELTKGWAVFNNDMLLSNFPLNTNNRPTKESLQKQAIWKEDYKGEEVVFYFGKYNGKTVQYVMKENKGYLTWLLDSKEFKWYGVKGEKLKETIEMELGVAKTAKPIVKTEHRTKQDSKELIQKYLANIPSFKDLDSVF